MTNKALIVIVSALILGMAISDTAFSASPAQDLQNAIQKSDIKAVRKAVEELVRQNDETAFNALSSAALGLEGKPESADAYWGILNGIGRLTNKDVIPKITNLILKHKDSDLGRSLLFAMRNNQSPDVIPLLNAVIEKGTYEMKLAAIRQLGNIRIKESVEALINLLKTIDEKDKSKKELLDYVYASLNDLTRQPDKFHTNYTLWMEWWEKSKDKPAAEIIVQKKIFSGEGNVDKYRPMTAAQSLEKDKVIVVRNDRCDENIKKAGGKGFDCNFDHIQDILAALNIPYTLIGKSELEKESYSLDDKWALVFNCNLFAEHCCNPEHLKLPPPKKKLDLVRLWQCPGTENHINHKTELSDKTIKKIKRFVETGGYLFTEDLNIMEIVQRAFPKTISQSAFISERTVRILPEPAAVLHPYLKYVFEAPPIAQPPAMGQPAPSGETRSVPAPGALALESEWQIDDESPNIKINSQSDVVVLITSPQIAKQYKDEGAVAVTFRVIDPSFQATGGKDINYLPGGRVLHVMSHFGHQRSKVSEFALQNLLVNFLEELGQHKPKAPKTVKK
ncbi:MAG: HEAT repeat domain-containing protein [Planctomycetes bacterium]|nr:HEAT repeat domain-containing protein [Planctomycetota bacterium]